MELYPRAGAQAGIIKSPCRPPGCGGGVKGRKGEFLWIFQSWPDRAIPYANFRSSRFRGRYLTKILEAGRLAPTACNLQPQHVYVLQSQAALDAIRAITPLRLQCPCGAARVRRHQDLLEQSYSGHSLPR